ncbi:unnamed protein product [Amoebophrya sp. A120]|nr:unnamed protein product [Amoebophrya sp. A120]|eukprot:GSA120T00021944001.1
MLQMNAMRYHRDPTTMKFGHLKEEWTTWRQNVAHRGLFQNIWQTGIRGFEHSLESSAGMGDKTTTPATTKTWGQTIRDAWDDPYAAMNQVKTTAVAGLEQAKQKASDTYTTYVSPYTTMVTDKLKDYFPTVMSLAPEGATVAVTEIVQEGADDAMVAGTIHKSGDLLGNLMNSLKHHVGRFANKIASHLATNAPRTYAATSSAVAIGSVVAQHTVASAQFQTMAFDVASDVIQRRLAAAIMPTVLKIESQLSKAFDASFCKIFGQEYWLQAARGSGGQDHSDQSTLNRGTIATSRGQQAFAASKMDAFFVKLLAVFGNKIERVTAFLQKSIFAVMGGASAAAGLGGSVAGTMVGRNNLQTMQDWVAAGFVLTSTAGMVGHNAYYDMSSTNHHRATERRASPTATQFLSAVAVGGSLVRLGTEIHGQIQSATRQFEAMVDKQTDIQTLLAKSVLQQSHAAANSGDNTHFASGQRTGVDQKQTKITRRELQQFWQSAEGKYLQKQWDRNFSNSEQLGLILESQNQQTTTVMDTIVEEMEKIRARREQYRLQIHQAYIEKKVAQRLQMTSFSASGSVKQREQEQERVKKQVEEELLAVYEKQEQHQIQMQNFVLEKIEEKCDAYREGLPTMRENFYHGMKKAFFDKVSNKVNHDVVEPAVSGFLQNSFDRDAAAVIQINSDGDRTASASRVRCEPALTSTALAAPELQH